MGHAKRNERRQAARRAPAADAEKHAVLDDGAVERILESRLGTGDGDPITGIRNALIAAAGFWAVLGLVIILLA